MRGTYRSALLYDPPLSYILGAVFSAPFVHFSPTLFTTMHNFTTVADQLDLTIDEILEILDLTVEDAKEENLSPDEIIEALIDNGLDVWGDDDWAPGCDSCSNFIDA